MRNPFLALAALLPAYLCAQPAPLTIDLAGALDRARAYSPQFLAAGITAGLAREDRVQAKAALLPTLNSVTGYLYTQGNGTDTGVFVSNNGVHVYDEQATIHSDLYSPVKLADYQRTRALEAAAIARQSVARRGLAVTVIQNYYAVVAAQRRLVNARLSLEEARQFEDLTQKQEAGGEVAHADVVKAQLQRRQRERELSEAEGNVSKTKLNLAVLVFQDLLQPFEVTDDLSADAALLNQDEARRQAVTNNPDIQAAEAGLRAARFGVKSARAEFLPTLSFDYFYGLDANQFALHDPEGHRLLGSVVQASMTIPIWNWGATRSKVRQSELQRQQAQNDVNFAQRGIQANLNEFYLEANIARAQLASLMESVNLAAESLRLTLLRYQGGEATALEVVDAQSAALDARNAYDDGLGRYRMALANLETLTGRY